ncbi:helix-turn-helix domain-containing protein [Myroides sp. LJL119]
MLDTSKILRRVKKMVGIKTDLELSKLLNVKPNTISSWKKRNSLQYEAIIELCAKYKIDLNELFFSDYHKVSTGAHVHGRVKMITVDQHLEYFLNPEEVLRNAPSYVFPTTEPVDFAVQVASENMYPTIRVSSYVLLKKVEVQSVQPFHIYLYILQGKGIFMFRFKRLTQECNLLFTSDNPNIGNTEVDPSQIREIYEVKALFSPNLKHIGDQ